MARRPQMTVTALFLDQDRDITHLHAVVTGEVYQHLTKILGTGLEVLRVDREGRELTVSMTWSQAMAARAVYGQYTGHNPESEHGVYKAIQHFYIGLMEED